MDRGKWALWKYRLLNQALRLNPINTGRELNKTCATKKDDKQELHPQQTRRVNGKQLLQRTMEERGCVCESAILTAKT